VVDVNSLLQETAGHRYAHIDAMRALAVSLVVVAHTNIGGIPGGSGVTIFFTISGFVIANLVLREQRSSGRFDLRNFYRRRFRKLAPPLLVVVIIPTALYSAFGGEITWKPVLLQVFFMFNWVAELTSGDIHILPGTSVVWSLSIEEQFYIAFSVVWLLAIKASRHPRRALALACVMSIVVSTGLRLYLAADPANSARISYGTDTRLDGIALGILIALALNGPHADRLVRSRRGWDLLIVGALLVFLISLVVRDQYFRDTARYTLQSGAAAAAIVYGFGSSHSRLRSLFDRCATNTVVQFVGLASYSIYLSHDVVMRPLSRVLVSWPTAVQVPVLAAVGFGVGILVWRSVEVPVLRAGRREQHA
jgi:peptidoglycan/LPS O-acetylase OafA/YrhL